MISKPDSALVIVGHGSTVNPDSSTPTHAHADDIRRRGCFGEVHCCFWKEEPGMREVLRMIERDDIYIVPNFISEGYFTQKVIPRELELAGDVTVRGGRRIKYCEPVGNHARMTDALLHRAAEVAPGVPRSKTSLIIIGHGTDLNDNSAKAVKNQVALIRERADYAEVISAYMEEAPLVADWAAHTTQPHVVAVPFFVSDGLHSYQDIPVLLGMESEPTEAAGKREVFRHNPHHLQGRELYYASSIGTDPLFADVILDQVEAFDQRHAGAALVA
jgi:sirohydrochlorin cobaltochelatase